MVFSVTSEAVLRSTDDKFKPIPGSSTFTQKRPMSKEINEAEKNQAIAFPPMRPTALMSPNLAIPTTKVVNTKGAIII